MVHNVFYTFALVFSKQSLNPPPHHTQTQKKKII
jgi:hypothetical protein